MEVAQTREYPAVRWYKFDASTPVDGFRMDGERRYYEFHQGHSEPEPVEPRGYLQFRMWNR